MPNKFVMCFIVLQLIFKRFACSNICSLAVTRCSLSCTNMLRIQENSQLDCLLGSRLVQTMVNFFLAHLNNTTLHHFQDAVDAGKYPTGLLAEIVKCSNHLVHLGRLLASNHHTQSAKILRTDQLLTQFTNSSIL